MTTARMLAGAAALAFGAASLSSAFAQTAAPSAKMTKAQCETLWTQALAGSTGDLAMDKAKPYVKDFNKADKNADSKLSQTEWTAACDQGWIQSAAPGSASTGASTGTGTPEGKTSDRSAVPPTDREPGSTDAGAPGAERGQTPSGTSDRTPTK